MADPAPIASPAAGARLCVHATAIAVAGHAVLIRGPSGSGKSDLALRCLAVPAGPFAAVQPRLVADDQVEIDLVGAEIRLRARGNLSGLIEVRGIGIVAQPAVAEARLALVADIVGAADIERMPDPPAFVDVCGIVVHHLRITAWEHSAPLKLLLALMHATTSKDAR